MRLRERRLKCRNGPEVVADQMMTLWAQFAKTGTPSVEGLTDWPAWDVEGDQYLDIGYTLEVKTGVADGYVPPPNGATFPMPIPPPADE